MGCNIVTCKISYYFIEISSMKDIVYNNLSTKWRDYLVRLFGGVSLVEKRVCSTVEHTLFAN